MDDTQSLYNIIALLVDKLGGEVSLSYDEIDNPPVIANAIRNGVTNTVTIKTEKQ